MLRNFIVIFILFISIAFGMETVDQFTNQSDSDKYCAQTSLTNYKIMIENVEFSYSEDDTATGSKRWRTVGIYNPLGLAEFKFLTKKRDIPLSTALEDLLSKNSQTSFACAMAMTVTVCKILAPFGLDDMISTLEKEDKNYIFPLLSHGLLAQMEEYLHRFDFNPLSNDWKMLQQMRERLSKLPILEAIKHLPLEISMFSPFESAVDGMLLYLPNVEGVRGVGAGENLFCVNAEKGLYYGFGDCFKDGPKTLLEIGKSLESYANQNYPGLYAQKVAHIIVKEGCHPLQYLIKPEHCSFISLEYIRAIQSLK